jgi:carbonic anhydrase
MVSYYMDVTNKQRCKYSQFVIAGAAVGVIAPAFRSWHETFWENLASSVQLHGITKVIAIDHRDCGAIRIAYGDRITANPDTEKNAHRQVLAAFRREVSVRQPDLEVVTGLMALDGQIEIFT